MSTNVSITQTPAAPYIDLLMGMNRNEKIAVASYLVKSLPGVEIVETDDNHSILPEDESYLAKKLENMSFSPRIEKLFERQREASESIDMNDGKTRHLLGIR